MENNNGRGIFYGVIGVATLIVAIIGATFAYFTATTTSGEYLTGTAATAGLSVHATRLTTFSAAEIGKDASTASYIMVPQPDSTLSQAVAGSPVEEDGDNIPCIDANGSLVCTIYKITVSNTGSAAIDITGTINFIATDTLISNDVVEDGTGAEGESGYFAEGTTAKMKHLKWAKLNKPTDEDGAVDASGSLIPTTLTTYDGGENPYFYAIKNATAIQDYLGGTLRNGTNEAYSDLITPEDDLVAEGANYVVNPANPALGTIHLEAAGSTADADNDGVNDDTATLYIVIWISENQASQNADDVMSFAGQVTFQSSAGSGATSSFTETALTSD